MRKLFFVGTIVVFSSALSVHSNAQVPLTTRSPKDKSIEDKYRSDEIERVRRGTLTPRARHESRFPQIKEDFERIQMLNGDILQAISSDQGQSRARISEAAAEIHKRANRLKSNLFVSQSKGHEAEIESSALKKQALKTQLLELDKAITSFVHNPIFENTKVVNPDDSRRAEKDLQKIIDLSGSARKKTK
ncbi:MAG TPA: hypothetical protein VJ023_19055 [Pyrinomonadaceae bacterium]|nr:hypothetical protein [Pyrinomonadaceae bacterium]